MTDPVYTSLPSILWRIENYATCGKKIRTLSYLGLSWKLIFSRYVSNGTPMMMLRLECFNVPENLQTLKLVSDTCILRHNGCHTLPLKSEMALKDEELVLWSYATSTIGQYIAQESYACFFVTIYPCEIQKENILLLEKIRLQAEEDKASCKAYLCKDIAQLYENSELSDFELRCKELRMPVHKAVLSARCGYFVALFRSPMKETDKGYVEFSDIEPDILKHVMKYLYSGTLSELALERLPEVYAVADRFDFKSLKVKCASLVIDSFDEEHQTITINASLDQEAENRPVLLDDRRKKLLKQLFRSSEWKTLFKECPTLAGMMCTPVIMEIPEI